MTELRIGSLVIPDCETFIQQGYFDWGRLAVADPALPDWHHASEEERRALAELGYRIFDGAAVFAGNDLGSGEAYLSLAVNSWVSHQDVGRLLQAAGPARPLLARIPEQAPLEAAEEEPLLAAAELLDLLCGLKYIKLAKATKVLYRKRPLFIPVIDDLILRFLRVNFRREELASNLSLLRLYRRLLRDHEPSLAAIQQNLAGIGLELSRARILSYVVWLAQKQVLGRPD